MHAEGFWDLSKTNRKFPDKFVIWYVDKSVVEGTNISDWINSPDEGVCFILEIFDTTDETGYVSHTLKNNSGSDWYWIDPNLGVGKSLNPNTAEGVNEWIALDLPENADHPKMGKWASDEDYEEIMLDVTNYVNKYRGQHIL